MSKKVSQNKRKYFYAHINNNEIIKIYKDFDEIKLDFPNSIYSCIFSVCNGSKKSHFGRN